MLKLIDLSRDTARGKSSIEATFMNDGELVPLRVSQEDKPETYQAINAILSRPGLDVETITEELYALMSPVTKVQNIIKRSVSLSNSLSIEDGVLKFGDNVLEETLATHMLSLLDETNTPKNEKLWKSYVRFLDNLFQNVNAEIRSQLFRWMDYENKAGNAFGITEDGCFVGYKGCKGTILEPMSSFTGFAIVDGEDVHGHIPNKVGSVIQMPRSEVQFDPQVGCSQGLHVGTRNYAVSWAPILILVKVNPRDVVSVPFECDSQKMRVCEYTVLKVTDASEEHQRFHYDETEYDDEYYDEDECCDECDDSDYEENEDYGELLGNDLSLSKAYELKNKNVYVEYDNKNFEGKIVDIFDDRNNSGIIIKDGDGEYKHIKLHRITYWEVLDVNEDLKDDEEFIEEVLSEAVNKFANIITSILSDDDFKMPF